MLALLDPTHGVSARRDCHMLRLMQPVFERMGRPRMRELEKAGFLPTLFGVFDWTTVLNAKPGPDCATETGEAAAGTFASVVVSATRDSLQLVARARQGQAPTSHDLGDLRGLVAYLALLRPGRFESVGRPFSEWMLRRNRGDITVTDERTMAVAVVQLDRLLTRHFREHPDR